MQIQTRQYPHPVLSKFTDDILDHKFETELAILPLKTVFRFEANCVTDSEDILQLIQQQSAHYAFHVECRGTRVRRIFKSFNEDFVFEIPAEELDGKVQVCSFILAAEDVPSYYNKNFHPDYDNHSFTVMKGDVLAVGEEVTFMADKEVDPLQKVPSIFTVSLNGEKDAPSFDVDASGQKAVIKLSKENFEHYRSLSQNPQLQVVLGSLFIMPALVYLIESMKADNSTDGHELEETRWYRVLIHKLKAHNIDLEQTTDSSVLIAQKLLGDPIPATLKAFEAFTHEE